MKTETIIYKNKKVIKKTKNNGEVNYVLRGVYLGLDEKTGKQVTTSITAKTLRQLDRKYIQAKLDFEEQGSTRKEVIRINTLEELAEEWFKNYQNWVTSANTLNRVRPTSFQDLENTHQIKLNLLKSNHGLMGLLKRQKNLLNLG